jgi:hypothetical protein
MTAEQFHGETSDVFRNLYWSAESPQSTDTILRNRLALLRNFGIAARCRAMFSEEVITTAVLCEHIGKTYELDHLEAYSCRNGQRLLVCSNYNHKAPPWMLMAEHPPVYTESTTTWVRTFRNAQEAQIVLRAFDALAWCFDRRPLQFMRSGGNDIIATALRELMLEEATA